MIINEMILGLVLLHAVALSSTQPIDKKTTLTNRRADNKQQKPVDPNVSFFVKEGSATERRPSVVPRDHRGSPGFVFDVPHEGKGVHSPAAEESHHRGFPSQQSRGPEETFPTSFVHHTFGGFRFNFDDELKESRNSHRLNPGLLDSNTHIAPESDFVSDAGKRDESPNQKNNNLPAVDFVTFQPHPFNSGDNVINDQSHLFLKEHEIKSFHEKFPFVANSVGALQNIKQDNSFDLPIQQHFPNVGQGLANFRGIHNSRGPPDVPIHLRGHPGQVNPNVATNLDTLHANRENANVANEPINLSTFNINQPHLQQPNNGHPGQVNPNGATNLNTLHAERANPNVANEPVNFLKFDTNQPHLRQPNNGHPGQVNPNLNSPHAKRANPNVANDPINFSTFDTNQPHLQQPNNGHPGQVNPNLNSPHAKRANPNVANDPINFSTFDTNQPHLQQPNNGHPGQGNPNLNSPHSKRANPNVANEPVNFSTFDTNQPHLQQPNNGHPGQVNPNLNSPHAKRANPNVANDPINLSSFDTNQPHLQQSSEGQKVAQKDLNSQTFLISRQTFPQPHLNRFNGNVPSPAKLKTSLDSSQIATEEKSASTPQNNNQELLNSEAQKHGGFVLRLQPSLILNDDTSSKDIRQDFFGPTNAFQGSTENLAFQRHQEPFESKVRAEFENQNKILDAQQLNPTTFLEFPQREEKSHLFIVTPEKVVDFRPSFFGRSLEQQASNLVPQGRSLGSDSVLFHQDGGFAPGQWQSGFLPSSFFRDINVLV